MMPHERRQGHDRQQFIFEVYRQIDVSRFVKLLDYEGGVLLSVESRGGVCDRRFRIMYRHETELEIEVLT